MNGMPTDSPLRAAILKNGTLTEEGSRLAREEFLRVYRARSSNGQEASYLKWAVPVALAASLLLAILTWPSGTLQYQVSGAHEQDGYILAPDDQPVHLTFSDKTVIEATARSRFRVGELHKNGALVILESGELSIDVTHTGKGDWSFAAGPYKVRVTGTRFDMVYDPTHDRLRVSLIEGSVEVEGPASKEPMALVAGQNFFGNHQQRRMEVRSSAPGERDSRGSAELSHELVANEKRSAAAPKDAPAVGVPELTKDLDKKTTSESGQHALESSKQGATVKSWPQLVSDGKFQEVVKSARKRGETNCLSTCSSSDLSALADAARYTGANSLSARTLLALRRRFPSSAGPRTAFLLGRVYETQGSTSESLKWYELSLKNSPSGAYAAESLAGKMRVVLSTQGKGAATPIAKTYLEQYPRGIHAETARQIVRP